MVARWKYGLQCIAAALVILSSPGAKLHAGPSVAEKDVNAPVHLEVENQLLPRAVGNPTPRLSWRSPVNSQDAYQIQAASSVYLLAEGKADLWDSGTVTDDRTLAIPYGGEALASRQQVFWRVRIWADGSSEPGPWSEPGSWRMALLDQSDWQAEWIASPPFDPATVTPGIDSWLNATAADPQFNDREIIEDTRAKLRAMRPATYFRRDFIITKPVRSATLYSTSAGYSEFFLSGEKLGDRILNPAQTDFDKRIYFDTDDVTHRLSPGKHTLAVHLGNGFYAERTAFGLDSLFYGEPAAIAQLEITYADGSQEVIVSDDTWTAHPSPILKNGVYSGEVFDARLQLSDWSSPVLDTDLGWVAATVMAEPPTQALVAAEMPPVRRVREVTPETILNPEPGVWTIDFGQNFTGVPAIEFSQMNLSPGQTVVLRYAEWADESGKVGMNSGGAAPRTKQVDAYVSDGIDARPWSPAFTWHGFRYMEVSGISEAPPIKAFSGHLVRTDIERIGHFRSSSALLNKIHDAALWTFESNLVSVLSDCPIRERNGWTGDAHAIVRMASYNYDMPPYLEKFLGDFSTTEEIAPTIVPGRRTRSGMVDWAAAEVFMTWEHYLHSGDLSVIERQYDSLLDYLDYVETVAENDLITDNDHFYGDWCDHLPQLGMERPLGRCMSFSTPGELTASALVLRSFDQMASMASILGREEDSDRFEARRDEFRTAFNMSFFDHETGTYGSQTANAMALSFGIAPPSEVDRIAASLDRDVRIAWNGHASVGALGQPWLYPALSDHGYTDTALGIFTAPGAPGYSYLFNTLGGTTLWEDISKFVPEDGVQPGKSLSHPFKGGYDAWFYSGLGGINPDPDYPGYKRFRLSPVFPADLDEASVSLDTGYGLIRSEWNRVDGLIRWQAEIPYNTQATVRLGGALAAARQFGPGVYNFTISAAGDRLISSERR